MAILEKSKQPHQRIQIDLTGPDGNAYVLMGYAKQYGKELSMSKEEIETMISEMKMSDYENLIEVFDGYFGEFIDLLR